MVTLRATNDEQAQMSYVYVRPDASSKDRNVVDRTIAYPGLNVDLDRDGNVYGVEFFGCLEVSTSETDSR